MSSDKVRGKSSDNLPVNSDGFRFHKGLGLLITLSSSVSTYFRLSIPFFAKQWG